MNTMIKWSLTLLVVGQFSFAEGRKGTTTSSAPLIPEGNHPSKRHEILINAGEFFQSEVTSATLSFNNLNRIAIGGAYFYRLNEMIQIGPRASIAYVDLGVSGVTDFQLLACGRVNLPLNWDFENALFGGLQLGLGNRSVTGASATTMLLGFEAGKRFLLFPNFTWQPTLAVTIPTSSLYGSASFAFRLLQASLVF